jgi:hypothetical protein
MQEILDRLVNKIIAAPIDPAPSDNIYMENVFEPTIYQQILNRLPADDIYHFIDHPDAMLPDGTRTRKLLDLTDASISRFQAEDQTFWRMMRDMMTSELLQRVIVQKFYAKLRHRFGRDIPELVTVPIFYRDLPGYYISVHTDAPYKVATLQFYFPEDESQIHLGTSFHQRVEHEFPVYKTNQFKPNSAYAFARTDSSWHSVQQIASHEKQRNTLALTIYVKGHEYQSEQAQM